MEIFFCVFVNKPLVLYTPLAIRNFLVNLNNIDQYEDIRRIFKKTSIHADKQADGWTDRHTECMNTFQLCWKVLIRKSLWVSYFCM